MATAKNNQAISLDWVGAACSMACAIHCAVTPILLSALPSLSAIHWFADPLFHQVVAILCTFLVYRAIAPHCSSGQNSLVGTLALSGVVMVLVAAFVLPDACTEHAPNSPARSLADRQAGQLRLVSAGFDGLSLLAKPNLRDAEPSINEATCRMRHQTLGRSLLTTEELSETIGHENAARLLRLQRFLTPIGGLLLISAHLLNMRHQRCRSARCGV